MSQNFAVDSVEVPQIRHGWRRSESASPSSSPSTESGSGTGSGSDDVDQGGPEEGGDELEVWYFPSKLTELNVVEGCWDKLQEWFEHRLIPNLSTLEEYLPRGLNPISEPDIWPYLTSKDSF